MPFLSYLLFITFSLLLITLSEYFKFSLYLVTIGFIIVVGQMAIFSLNSWIVKRLCKANLSDSTRSYAFIFALMAATAFGYLVYKSPGIDTLKSEVTYLFGAWFIISTLDAISKLISIIFINRKKYTQIEATANIIVASSTIVVFMGAMAIVNRAFLNNALTLF